MEPCHQRQWIPAFAGMTVVLGGYSAASSIAAGIRPPRFA